MSSVKKIEVNLCTENPQMLVATMNRILNLPRIGLSVLLSGSMTAVLLLAWGSNDAVIPLTIFSGLITILFLALLGYAVTMRPKLKNQVERECGKRGTAEFEGTSFTVAFEGIPKRQISYKAIRGQYWFGDYYILYIDDSNYQTLLCVSVDRDSFDNLYMLAGALTDRKVKLVQIKNKQKQ